MKKHIFTYESTSTRKYQRFINEIESDEERDEIIFSINIIV